MKKIILVCSFLLTLLFPCSLKSNYQATYNKASLLSNNKDCNKYDSIVNITTTNNLINTSGFIIARDEKYIYIATSYFNYNKVYNYEVVFNDYSRRRASVVGYALEDEVLLLKVEIKNDSYCVVLLSKSQFIDEAETLDIIGSYNYQISVASSIVTKIGVCKNCNEETFKNYFYTMLTVDISDYLLGAGAFDKKGNLLGIITNRVDGFKNGISMLDVNKLRAICYSLITTGDYAKNYIKYNLLDVNSLTNYEKYLYSLDEGLTSGVLVSSIHYLNYLWGGLNQGMVILGVNDIGVNNRYELDNVLSLYQKGEKVNIKVRTITGVYRTYEVKV